jgi:hypothetical protein
MSRQRATPQKRTGNVYDQACRFLLQLDVAVLLWLLGLSVDEVAFDRWLNTRHLPWPGQPDRTCDTVAYLRDRTDGGRPWAQVAEFQVEPDPEMFGRLLEYLGAAWRQLRPSAERGDRFCVGAVVVNLTGKGQCSQRMRLGKSRVWTDLGVAEWTLAEESADQLLRLVKAGKVPRLALAWLPLMQRGGEVGIIRRWLELARQEPDQHNRQALGLALVFAEKAGWGEAWRRALEGWEMTESEIVNEWTAQARAEGEAKGEVKGRAAALLRVLGRWGEVPQALRQAIGRVKGSARLDGWIDLALQAQTLDEFRQQAGL